MSCFKGANPINRAQIDARVAEHIICITTISLNSAADFLKKYTFTVAWMFSGIKIRKSSHIVHTITNEPKFSGPRSFAIYKFTPKGIAFAVISERPNLIKLLLINFTEIYDLTISFC